jgi:hypothetical protein
MRNPFGTKVIRSTTLPDKRCCGCGKAVRSHGGTGIYHCSKPACVRKAARHMGGA